MGFSLSARRPPKFLMVTSFSLLSMKSLINKMAESLKDARQVKATLLGLITQSFQTNLNLMACLQQAGIELSEEEWQTVLGTQNTGQARRTLTSGDNLLGALCTDDRQSARLSDVKERLDRVHGEIRMIKGQLIQFEQIGGSEFLLGEPLALLENSHELPQKVIDIESQVNKLQTFENTHLDSTIR